MRFYPILAAGLLLANTTAHADALLTTASSAAETGSYAIDSQDFIATTLTLSSAETITAIGGNFTQYGDGNPIFAAISSSSSNLGNWNASGNLIADSVFTPAQDNSDSLASFSVTLNPGTYAIVLGSGLFGATGQSGLASGQYTIGSPVFFQSSDAGKTWNNYGAQDMRLVVEGMPTAVPVPAALPLMLSGLGVIGLMPRRRSFK